MKLNGIISYSLGLSGKITPNSILQGKISLNSGEKLQNKIMGIYSDIVPSEEAYGEMIVVDMGIKSTSDAKTCIQEIEESINAIVAPITAENVYEVLVIRDEIMKIQDPDIRISNIDLFYRYLEEAQQFIEIRIFDFSSDDFKAIYPDVLWSDSEYGWTRTTEYLCNGQPAFRSYAIPHSTQSEQTIQFITTGGGQISFSYRVSSERNCDKFSVTLDGVTIINGISGLVDWTDYSVSIDAGEHTLVLLYEKDSSINSNDDLAEIANLEIKWIL